MANRFLNFEEVNFKQVCRKSTTSIKHTNKTVFRTNEFLT